MREQPVEVERGPRGQLDVDAHPLAEHLVGLRNRGRERNRGMRAHLVLHLGRADVLPAADDDVGGAAHDRQHAVRVERADVAHQHPPVRGEQLCVGGLVVEVAHAGRGPPPRGSSPPRRGHVAVVVVQPHLHIVDDAARGAQPALTRVFEGGSRQHAGLVRSEELQHRASGHAFERVGVLVRHGFAAGEQHPQRREVALPHRRRVEHHDELRAHAREHRDPMAFDELERVVGIETLRDDERRAEECRGEVRGPQAEPERRGHRAQHNLVARQTTAAHRELMEVHPSVLRVHHTLRQPRRPRRRVDQEQIVRAHPPALQHLPRHRRRCRHTVDENRIVGCRLEARHDDVGQRGGAMLAPARDQLARVTTTMLGERHERGRIRTCEQVSDLAIARVCADADRSHARELRREQGRVHRSRVGEQHAHARALGEELPQGLPRAVSRPARSPPRSTGPHRRERQAHPAVAPRACGRNPAASDPPTNPERGTRTRPVGSTTLRNWDRIMPMRMPAIASGERTPHSRS